MTIFQKIIRALKARLHYVNLMYPAKGSVIGKSSKFLNASIHGLVDIGEQVKIVHGVTLYGERKISVGDNSIINGPNTSIKARINEISIGKFCSIARNVDIQEFNHSFKGMSTYFVAKHLLNAKDKNQGIYSNGPIRIGNDVWIATQCVILSGVTIGNGAIVAANTVVNKDVPPYAIVGGTPAKVIGYRFEQPIIDKLQELSWWDWDQPTLEKHRHLFLQEEISLEDLEQILHEG